jgi:hypothetical protein
MVCRDFRLSPDDKQFNHSWNGVRVFAAEVRLLWYLGQNARIGRVWGSNGLRWAVCNGRVKG